MTQYFKTPQPPPGSPPPGPAQRGAHRSGAAVVSLCLGIVSVFCLGFGPLLGVPALILGIVALVGIGRSNGQLKGKGFAIGGICCAIVGFAIFGVTRLPAVLDLRVSADSDSRERSALVVAELNIRSNDSGQTGFGNTPEAKALADDFARKMKILRESLFTGEAEGGQSGGEFLTHCEMNQDRCAFIVHVPGLRKFNDEAKESLCEIAWTIAHTVLTDSDLPGGSRLAVGVKGVVLYEDIMIGDYLREGDSAEPSSGTGSDRLKPFFPKSPVTGTGTEPELEKTPADAAGSSGAAATDLPNPNPLNQ